MDNNTNRPTYRHPLDPREVFARREGIDEDDAEAREDFWEAILSELVGWLSIDQPYQIVHRLSTNIHKNFGFLWYLDTRGI
jgi:hypothetical protein